MFNALVIVLLQYGDEQKGEGTAPSPAYRAAATPSALVLTTLICSKLHLSNMFIDVFLVSV